MTFHMFWNRGISACFTNDDFVLWEMLEHILEIFHGANLGDGRMNCLGPVVL